MDRARTIESDCVEVMAEMDENSVDAIVTDPPYGLEFMGKGWDKLADDAVTKSWNTKGRSKTGAPRRNPNSPGGRHAATGRIQQNPRCVKCGRVRDGQDTAKGFKVCHCENTSYRIIPKAAQRAQIWHQRWAEAALRVLKPGGHLLAFGGTRTYHRLACAIEDAGFEIRDSILAWVYATGFPKGHDIRKVVQKKLEKAIEEQGYEFTEWVDE